MDRGRMILDFVLAGIFALSLVYTLSRPALFSEGELFGMAMRAVLVLAFFADGTRARGRLRRNGSKADTRQ